MIYYGKLWSTGPKKFKFISEERAFIDYKFYLDNVKKSKSMDLREAFSFKEWLAREI